MILLRKMVVFVMVFAMVTVTGCGYAQEGADRNPIEIQSELGMTLVPTDGEIPLVTMNNRKYVDLSRLMQMIGFYTEWDEATNRYLVGSHDVEVQLQPDSEYAEKDERSIQLPSAPILMKDEWYLPIDAIPVLFDGEFNYVVKGNVIQLIAPDEDQSSNELDDFGEDPNDPSKGDEEAVWLPYESAPVLKKVNMNKLIRTSRSYMGVKYKFGANHYSKSRRFDCSSYTKYVFGKHGVTLKRTARNQAKQGKTVSKKSLRKGDLLFFYVPGRFKSNKVIGHVGIYIGNNQMIHSSPAPENGVQISNINNAHWKETYIKAKRVAS